MKIVPNEFPKLAAPYKVALIGEAPGEREEEFGRPFVERAGEVLDQIAASAGLQRSSCFVGNIVQVRPPNNQIGRFKPDGVEFTKGRAALRKDLEAFQPNLCVLLGNTPLKEAGINRQSLSFRGGLFRCQETSSPFYGFKCLATLHPAAVARMWSWWPLLQFDLQRAADQGTSPDLNLPKRIFHTNPSTNKLLDFLKSIQDGEVALDIEGGGTKGIICCGFAVDPLEGWVFVPSQHTNEGNLLILKEIKRILASPKIGKILQNGNYDNFCLAYHWGCPILNMTWDTMLSGWELYPEIPKGLGTLASIYTLEPPYKWEKKSGNMTTFFEYNGKDATVTLEIAQTHREIFDPPQREHFEFNMNILPICSYMTIKGTRYDVEGVEKEKARVVGELRRLQGMIEFHADCEVNINSPTQLVDLLYKKKGFEPQYVIEKGQRTNKLTANRKALLTLTRKFADPILPLILEWKHNEGIRKQLEYKPDRNGRVRGLYNIVGTETGRFSCSISENDGAEKMYLPGGVPMHVITGSNQRFYLADEGYSYFQVDLEGADGWTVAAWCSHFSNYTMLEDYLAGLKPAIYIALTYLYQQDKIPHNPAKLNRTDLKDLGAEWKPKFEKGMDLFWLYFASKRVQHGTNYLLGIPTMMQQIMEDSYKQAGTVIWIRKATAEALQRIYIQRYPGVRAWQEHINQIVNRTGELPCASGHVRTFFGRRNSRELQREAVAHEPQANTTYATNWAAYNLWNDPENRKSNDLIIQPLHQVHDALCGQFPTALADWAVPKIRSYFDNTLTICNQQIKIPVEGAYGPSWGNLKDGKI